MNSSNAHFAHALRLGYAVLIRMNMGSAHCGDAEAILYPDGYIACIGGSAWQRYRGRVENCRVGYGLAELAMDLFAGKPKEHGYQCSYPLRCLCEKQIARRAYYVPFGRHPDQPEVDRPPSPMEIYWVYP